MLHEQLTQAVQEFIQRNPARFRPLRNDAVTVREFAGYTEKDVIAGTVYLILPEAFREACGGHDPAEVARELKRLELLKTNERDRPTTKHSALVNGENRRIRLYAVSDKILEFDYAEATNAASQITDGAAGAGGAMD